MEFSPASSLRRATGRAKSDVANKLVSMLLHDISRRLVEKTGAITVASASYTRQVEEVFGTRCLYCGRDLERDRVAVEHLDGMNRFRLGLHIPGNVAVSCKSCNQEKRRDDQLKELKLARAGWESFLHHDMQSCAPNCKTCGYWVQLFPDPGAKVRHLETARARILAFRTRFAAILERSELAKTGLRESVERLYRNCQQFAEQQIAELSAAALRNL
jgi:hypothetical protein